MSKFSNQLDRWILFNTPLEIGLRILVILSEATPNGLDLQRLVIYDYLVLHAGDIGGEFTSLHADTPHRFGEIVVKRKIVHDALELMYSKSLLDIEYTKEGITYTASDLTQPFLDLLETDYAKKLAYNANKITRKFGSFSDVELKEYINKNMNNWGREFEYESMVRGWDIK